VYQGERPRLARAIEFDFFETSRNLGPSFRGASPASEPGIHNHSRQGCLLHLLASKKHGTLYLGVTNDIVRRVHEHRTKAASGFTARYDVGKLMWFEILR